MAYTQVSITGYNANPPPDDGSQVSDNEVSWSKHKNKIGDPLKTAIESIDTNVKSFSDESPSGQSGTRMVFQQTSAPTGWTKETGSGFNDVAMRIVTGTVGSRTAQSDFSTVFGKTATDGYTLTVSDIPSHGHGVTDPGHRHDLGANNNQGDGSNPSGKIIAGTSGGGHAMWRTTTNANVTAAEQSISSETTGISINNTGGDGSHSHGMDIRVNYQDLIVAAKD